jgi:polyisoprenoid-binding protein YceI
MEIPLMQKQKTFLSALAALTLTSMSFGLSAFAADYEVDPTHTQVGFAVSHMVGKVRGGFKEFGGKFSFDADKASDTKGEFIAKTASIWTNNDKRDEHLRSPEFFDVKKYPEAKISNLKLSPAGDKKYSLTADVTLHGVTKPVTFDVEYGGKTVDPWGNNRIGFTATGKLNREDYGIVWNKTLETGGLVLGKEITLNIEVEATEAKADAKASAAKPEAKKKK